MPWWFFEGGRGKSSSYRGSRESTHAFCYVGGFVNDVMILIKMFATVLTVLKHRVNLRFARQPKMSVHRGVEFLFSPHIFLFGPLALHRQQSIAAWTGAASLPGFSVLVTCIVRSCPVRFTRTKIIAAEEEQRKGPSTRLIFTHCRVDTNTDACNISLQLHTSYETGNKTEAQDGTFAKKSRFFRPKISALYDTSRRPHLLLGQRRSHPIACRNTAKRTMDSGP